MAAPVSRRQAERRAPVEAGGLGAGWFIRIEPFLPGRLHRHGRPAQRRRLLLSWEGHVASGRAPHRPAGRRQVRTDGG